MTDRRDWGQPPQDQRQDAGRYTGQDHQRYPRQDHGRGSPDRPWRPEQYDPIAHQRRIGVPRQTQPTHEQARPSQGQARPARERGWPPPGQGWPSQGQAGPAREQAWPPPGQGWPPQGQAGPAREQAWPPPVYEQHPYPWQSQQGQPSRGDQIQQGPYPSHESYPYPYVPPVPPVPSGPPVPSAPPGRERGTSWAARHRALAGFLVFGVLVVIGGVAVVARGALRTTTATGTMTAAQAVPLSAAGCRTQLRNWLADGGKSRVSAVSGELSALGAASGKLAGGKPPAAVAAVRAAAASLRSGARKLAADAGPSCVPGMRDDLLAAARRYEQAASDTTGGMSRLTAGNDAKAVTDVASASAASRSGNALLAAATKAGNAFSAGQKS